MDWSKAKSINIKALISSWHGLQSDSDQTEQKRLSTDQHKIVVNTDNKWTAHSGATCSVRPICAQKWIFCFFHYFTVTTVVIDESRPIKLVSPIGTITHIFKLNCTLACRETRQLTCLTTCSAASKTFSVIYGFNCDLSMLVHPLSLFAFNGCQISPWWFLQEILAIYRPAKQKRHLSVSAWICPWRAKLDTNSEINWERATCSYVRSKVSHLELHL